MILLKKPTYQFKKYFVFLLLVTINNISVAQQYITLIPKNGKIVTIHNWLVAKPMPSNYYVDKQQKSSLQDGFSKDFLISIGSEKSPKIV